jgi:uncharacterized protein involved in outer membrane biogenesis
MAEILRKVAIGVGVFLGGAVLLVGIAIGALSLIDWNSFRDTIAGRASESTGRKVEIRGDLDVALSWRPQVRARDFVIANAEWGSKPEMVHAEDVYFQFRIWPLLVGRLEIDAMRLVGLTVLLEQQKDRANWDFRAKTPEETVVKAVTPQEREDFPVLRELVVEKAKLTFRNPSMKEPIVAEFSRLEGRGGTMDDPVKLTMKGTYQKSPFAVTADLGTFNQLRDGGEPYPVKAKIEAGETSASFQGTITKPVDFQGIDGAMTLKGKNLDELHRLLGLPLPQSPPYQLLGKLTEQNKMWSLKGFKGTLGSSDMQGDVSVDTNGKKPHLTAKVTSNALNMEDIEGFWAAKPEQPGSTKGEKAGSKPPAPRAEDAKEDEEAQQKQAEAGGPVIPEEAIRLDKMRGMDVDLDFQGKSIKSSGPALDNIKVKLKLVDGKATMQPFDIGIFKGRVAGTLVVDGSQKVPRVSGDLKANGVQLGTMLAALGIDDKSVGTFRGGTRFRTEGGTLHQLVSNMNGGGNLLMEGGQITNLILELMALDLQEALAQYIGGSDPARIGCFLAPFVIEEGKLRAEPWVLDTSDAVIYINGYIDLKNEKTEMTLLPHPKDFSFFNLRTTITVEGDLASRKADVNVLDAAFKVILKALAAPIMPLISPGQEEEARADPSCNNMIAKIQREIQQGEQQQPATRAIRK